MTSDATQPFVRLGLPSDGWLTELGVVLAAASADEVTARVAIGERLAGPDGAVHGGVHATLIESATSVGAALWFRGRGRIVGVHNATEMLVPVPIGDHAGDHAGDLTVRATPVHRDDRQQLWNAEVTDDGGRLVAWGQVRLQNLPDV